MLSATSCGVQLGLAHLDDVEVQLAVGHRGELLAQHLDVRALLADDDTGTRGVDRHAALLVRTLDDDLRDAGLLALFLDELADLDVFSRRSPYSLVSAYQRLSQVRLT
jgi:hypothetical protein